ncbi:hypothetical protein EVAR_33205_1 [Eumeta japonica]|uniref:Uncharacterized protein n=1 Tax=Eumeta variegata TaxID=151549 RepID=A0A4C1W2L6_EUMVA|nr:hypothetical protein EVAR_33205_1 [Eumeta japonica]
MIRRPQLIVRRSRRNRRRAVITLEQRNATYGQKDSIPKMIPLGRVAQPRVAFRQCKKNINWTAAARRDGTPSPAELWRCRCVSNRLYSYVPRRHTDAAARRIAKLADLKGTIASSPDDVTGNIDYGIYVASADAREAPPTRARAPRRGRERGLRPYVGAGDAVGAVDGRADERLCV